MNHAIQPSPEVSGAAKPRRWGSFRLRTMLVAMLLFGLLLAAVAWRRERASRQEELVAKLQSGGAAVLYDYHLFIDPQGNLSYNFDRTSPLSASLLQWLGQDFFHRPAYLQTPAELTQDTFDKQLFQRALTEIHTWKRLTLCTQTITSQELELIGRQRQVQSLHFDRVKFADADLSELSELTALRDLSFGQTPVAECDFAWLGQCKQLERLMFMACDMSDRNVESWGELPPLKAVMLRDCPGEIADFDWLKGQKELESLSLSGTAADDRILPHLQRMKKLRGLDLAATKVTGTTVPLKLPPAIVVLNISNTGIQSLDWLESLPNLERLAADGTELSLGDVAAAPWPAGMKAISLRGPAVDDAFLDRMAGMQQLQWLILTGEFSVEAENRLYAALPKCKIQLSEPASTTE